MKILKKIFQVIVKIINHCVPVDSRSLYFIPHPNCRTDKYDIINYSSDNVLVLLNYLLKKDSAEYYKKYVKPDKLILNTLKECIEIIESKKLTEE